MTHPAQSPNPWPVLVAHRGYAQRYPENSLPALQAAFAAGADWAEFDIQLSADGVPFLLHDADLQRTAGNPGCALDWDWRRLATIEVNEANRLGVRFQGVRIPRLQDVVALLGDWPHKQVFVEIKLESLQRFGIDMVVKPVLEILQPVASRCVIISFDSNAVLRARELARARIGWVIDGWSTKRRKEAERLQPEYLFCNYQRLPRAGDLWPGPWQWVLYDVNSAQLVRTLAARGAHLFETGNVEELLKDPTLPGASAVD